MASDNLPPIDFDKETEFDAKSFSKKIFFAKCLHKDAAYDRVLGQITCLCGAAWSGEQLDKLLDIIKKR